MKQKITPDARDDGDFQNTTSNIVTHLDRDAQARATEQGMEDAHTKRLAGACGNWVRSMAGGGR